MKRKYFGLNMYFCITPYHCPTITAFILTLITSKLHFLNLNIRIIIHKGNTYLKWPGQAKVWVSSCNENNQLQGVRVTWTTGLFVCWHTLVYITVIIIIIVIIINIPVVSTQPKIWIDLLLAQVADNRFWTGGAGKTLQKF